MLFRHLAPLATLSIVTATIIPRACPGNQAQCLEHDFDSNSDVPVCVDLLTSKTHCGGCHQGCGGEGSSCVNGQCMCAYNNQPACGGYCYDFARDQRACGKCYNAVSTTPDAPSDDQCQYGEACIDGKCGSCPPNHGACLDSDWYYDVCVNLMTDPNNCGSCGYRVSLLHEVG